MLDVSTRRFYKRALVFTRRATKTPAYTRARRGARKIGVFAFQTMALGVVPTVAFDMLVRHKDFDRIAGEFSIDTANSLGVNSITTAISDIFLLLRLIHFHKTD